MKVILLEPKGYCAGVVNAINIAKKARVEHPDKSVFLFGRLVHNENVISNLLKLNIKCLENTKDYKSTLSDIPKGSVIVFSAHGHNEETENYAKTLGLIIYDATCPKVLANMNLIKAEINNNNDVIYIGKAGHPECDAALSISNRVSLYDTEKLYNYYKTTNCPLVINQTTLNIVDLENTYKEIKKAFPNAKIANEICASTRLRQEAVNKLTDDVDLIIIVGDKRSSNSTRLFDIAKMSHPTIKSIFISSLEELDTDILKNKKYVAIASGASTPPEIIDDIYKFVSAY